MLQLIQNPPVQEVIDGASAQAVIALGSHYLEVAVLLCAQYGDVQGATTEVEHCHVRACLHGLLGGVVDGGCTWLGKNTYFLLLHAGSDGAALQLLHGVCRPGLGVG